MFVERWSHALASTALLTTLGCSTTTHLPRRAPDDALQGLKNNVATTDGATVVAPGAVPGARPIRAVVAFEPDGLRAVASDHETVVIPWQEVDAVSTRDRVRGAGYGAALGGIGAAAMLTALVLAGATDESCAGCEDDFSFSRGEQAVIAAVGGLVIGGAVGALVGWLGGYEHRWVITP